MTAVKSLEIELGLGGTLQILSIVLFTQVLTKTMSQNKNIRTSYANSNENPKPAPKNILLICVDDLRPQLKSFGASYINSPNIDWPKRAVRFILSMCKRHLKDWLNSQTAKGVNEKSHALQQYSRTIRVFSACGFSYWQDIKASNLLQTINGFTKLQQMNTHTFTDTGKPLSPRSKSHYLNACKQFANWMAMDGRISTNPINHLKMTCLIETRNPRRPLTLDEIHVLMAHIINSKPLRLMPGSERLLLYQFAIETGLRANEIRTLTRKGFDFDQLKVSVIRKHTKNKKVATLPLKPETARAIQEFSKHKTPTALVFRMPKNGLSKMLQQDVKNARKEWIQAAVNDPEEYRRRVESDFLLVQTDDGKLDFHALRHTFGTLLATSGVHPKIAQELMRHSNINLTMEIYTHAQTSQVAAAVNNLPDFRKPPLNNRSELYAS